MSGGLSYPEIARAVFEGGCRLLQLRDKTTPFEELVIVGKIMLSLAREYDALLIVNDNPYLAREIQADGVHVGQTDVPVEIAREIIGNEAIVGISTHSREQILEAQTLPVDYIAIGPIFSTSSKKGNCFSPLGIGAVRWAVENSRHPVVAIGGIDESNIKKIADTGVNGIALISAVMKEKDKSLATSHLLGIIQQSKIIP